MQVARVRPSSIAALSLVLAAALAHADSGTATATAAVESAPGLVTRAHLDFRITIKPGIRFPEGAALNTAAMVTRIRYARRGATSQLLVADAVVGDDGARRYTVTEP